MGWGLVGVGGGARGGLVGFQGCCEGLTGYRGCANATRGAFVFAAIHGRASHAPLAAAMPCPALSIPVVSCSKWIPVCPHWAEALRRTPACAASWLQPCSSLARTRAHAQTHTHTNTHTRPPPPWLGCRPSACRSRATWRSSSATSCITPATGWCPGCRWGRGAGACVPLRRRVLRSGSGACD